MKWFPKTEDPGKQSEGGVEENREDEREGQYVEVGSIDGLQHASSTPIFDVF